MTIEKDAYITTDEHDDVCNPHAGDCRIVYETITEDYL